MRQPRKILLVSTATGGVGGAERLVVTLGGALQARGWRVHYAYPPVNHTPLLRTWCQAAGLSAAPHPDVPTAATPLTPQSLVARVRFFRAAQADVINLQYGWNYIALADVLAARLAGCRQVIATVYHPAPWSGHRRRVLTGLAAWWCDAIVVACQAMRPLLQQAGVPDHKIHLVPPAVEAPTDYPSQAAARSRLHLDPAHYVIACLARLVPGKGVAALIEAVHRLPDPHRQIRLVVGGDGPARPALTRLAARRLPGRAVFLGRVDNVADLFAAADVFALPSRMEGFGLVFLEAGFHQVPSIGTAVGGIPDAISDGNSGLLVPLDDLDGLTAALGRLRDDPALRARLGHGAYQRASTVFTPARLADGYLKLIE